MELKNNLSSKNTSNSFLGESFLSVPRKEVYIFVLDLNKYKHCSMKKAVAEIPTITKYLYSRELQSLV